MAPWFHREAGCRLCADYASGPTGSGRRVGDASLPVGEGKGEGCVRAIGRTLYACTEAVCLLNYRQLFCTLMLHRQKTFEPASRAKRQNGQRLRSPHYRDNTKPRGVVTVGRGEPDAICGAQARGKVVPRTAAQHTVWYR